MTVVACANIDVVVIFVSNVKVPLYVNIESHCACVAYVPVEAPRTVKNTEVKSLDHWNVDAKAVEL